MHDHLDAVAGRALIVSRPPKDRDIKNILGRYTGDETNGARPKRAQEVADQASMPFRVSSRSALSFQTSICTILPPRTTKRST